MKTLAWIATLICIVGTVLNVYRLDACFALWIIGEVLWIYFDVRQRLYSRATLDLLGLILAAWGGVKNW